MRLREIDNLAKRAARLYIAPPNPLIAFVCTSLVIASIVIMAIRVAFMERNLTARTQAYERQANALVEHLEDHRKIVYRNHDLLMRNSKLLSDEVLRQRNQLDVMQSTLNQIANKLGK